MRVLVVDNEISMCSMLEMILMKQYQVVTEQTVKRATEIMIEDAPFNAAIASLDDGKGLEFLTWVNEQYPRTVRVLMSGGNYDNAQINKAILEGQITSFIEKPLFVPS